MVDNEDYRELRIAPVMTGGTSLAVWMGGVTAEIHRLVSSQPTIDPPAGRPEPSDDVSKAYRRLLDLTGTKAQVDVITGTSAGGLNGALLAAAWRLAVPPEDFDKIRTTWLEVGDLERLLRSPRQGEPPSLLKGDDYFTPQIKDVLDEWAISWPASACARDVDLATTVTTVRPEQRSRTDDFGELLNEDSHAHVLTFRRDHQRDDFNEAGWPERLALAARTSASIPGVFEPSYLPTNDEAANRSHRPNLEKQAAESFKTSRWAVDGGVVVNLPLTEALERVFRMSAERDVRRVILYVCPTPARRRSQAKDEPWAEMPTLREALATIVLAPRAEGISGDIDRIRDHNRAVNRQRAARRALAELNRLPDVDLVDIAGKLLGTYRNTRARLSVAGTVEQLLATERHNDAILRHQSTIEKRLVEARKTFLPQDDQIDDHPYVDAWKWGIAPVEQAVSIALDLLRRTERLPSSRAAAHKLKLEEARKKVHVARMQVDEIGAEDDDHWRGRFEVLRDTASDANVNLEDWATDSYSHHPIAEGTTGTKLQSAHKAIADALVKTAPVIRQLADQPDPPNPAPGTVIETVGARVRAALAGRRHVNLPPGQAVDQGAGAQTDQSAGAVPSPVVEAARELRADVDAVVPAGADVSQCGRRLLAVHVLQTMFVGDVVNCEQPVELMQVSYNSPNCLDPDRKPADKLAGPELARLGAFLKHSWRANDWLWGRMDAAYRLVELLLHPIRLRELNCTDGEVRAAVKDILGRALERAERDEINKDLKFLRHPNMPVPGGLPATTRIIAKRLQLLIAREELHLVGHEIKRSKALGAAEPDGGAFLRALRAAPMGADGRVEADAVPALVRQLTVGKETVGEDLGLRMLNRVALQGTAVAVNVLAGERTGLGVVSRLAARLKSPLHALNSVASVMLSGTKLGQAATVFLLAAAGAVVAVRLAGVEVSSGLLVVAELLLAGTVLVAMLRSGFLWQAMVLAVAVAVVGLAIAGDQVRDVVYTTDPNPAWKARGLTGDVSVLRIGVPIALALFVSVRAFNTWMALRGGVKSPKLRRGLVAPVVAIGAAGTVAAIGPQVGKALVTGQPNESATKDWVVDTAEFLNGIELTVVVLLLVLIPLAIGYGFDIAVRRWLRAVASGPRRWLRAVAAGVRRWLRAVAAGVRRSDRAAGADVAQRGSNERLFAGWRRIRTARRVRRLEERRDRLSREVTECEARLEKLAPKAGAAPNTPLPAPPPSPAGVTP